MSLCLASKYWGSKGLLTNLWESCNNQEKIWNKYGKVIFKNQEQLSLYSTLIGLLLY